MFEPPENANKIITSFLDDNEIKMIAEEINNV